MSYAGIVFFLLDIWTTISPGGLRPRSLLQLLLMDVLCVRWLLFTIGLMDDMQAWWFAFAFPATASDDEHLTQALSLQMGIWMTSIPGGLRPRSLLQLVNIDVLRMQCLYLMDIWTANGPGGLRPRSLLQLVLMGVLRLHLPCHTRIGPDRLIQLMAF